MDDNRITVYKGMRDFPPETMLKRNYVVSLIRDVFESYGFEPIETPAVEHWETLSGKYGEDEKLIYNFTDWGERRVGLRYDLTVPLARFVTNHLAQIPRPFKRYQIQPVWRADKPQKGRYREFYQCDIDTVGTPLLTADAEILKALSVVLIRLGFQGFLIQYNSRKIFPALTATLKTGAEGERSLARALDKLDKIGREGVREELLRYGFSPDQADRMDELLALEGKTDEKLSHLKRTLCEGPEKELFLKEIQELLTQRESSCSFTADPGLPHAYIDIKQFSYCMRTLIINEIDSRNGESLFIRVAGRDSSILITLEDRNRRVTREELDALLTPFATTHEMGTGLGLALCRTMLDKQGLPLDVTAPLEGGVFYTITLPTRKEEQT